MSIIKKTLLLNETGKEIVNNLKQLNTIIRNNANGEMNFESLIEQDAINEIDNEYLTRIADYTFYYFKTLTTINMPNVISIGSEAFRNCLALTTVDLPKVTDISNNAFDC